MVLALRMNLLVKMPLVLEMMALVILSMVEVLGMMTLKLVLLVEKLILEIVIPQKRFEVLTEILQD